MLWTCLAKIVKLWEQCVYVSVHWREKQLLMLWSHVPHIPHTTHTLMASGCKLPCGSPSRSLTSAETHAVLFYLFIFFATSSYSELPFCSLYTVCKLKSYLWHKGWCKSASQISFPSSYSKISKIRCSLLVLFLKTAKIPYHYAFISSLPLSSLIQKNWGHSSPHDADNHCDNQASHGGYGKGKRRDWQSMKPNRNISSLCCF